LLANRFTTIFSEKSIPSVGSSCSHEYKHKSALIKITFFKIQYDKKQMEQK
jgi:hypothetical protein